MPHARPALRLALSFVTAASCLAASPAVSAEATDQDLNVQRQTVSSSALATFLVVDPARVKVSAGVVSGGAPACFGGAARGNRCLDPLGAIVAREGADAGTTANYSDGVNILGTVIVNHHAYTPPNPSTTSLCVAGSGAGQKLAIVAVADPATCVSAVSGERLVTGGKVTIGAEGTASHDPFWGSVQAGLRVQRTLLGLRADGHLLVAVVSAARPGARDGMTLLDAARWLVAGGARDGMALDGGHQADMLSASAGDLVPLERGVVHLQSALLFTLPPEPPPPASPPTPTPPPPLPDTGLVSPLPDTALTDPLPDTGLRSSQATPRTFRTETLPAQPAGPLDSVGRAWTGIVADIRKLLHHP